VADDQEIYDKKTKLLKMIHEIDGTVPKDRFHRLAEKAGYDTKGVGGLFAWPNGGAKLREVEKEGQNEVALTQKGIEFLRGKGIADE